MAPATGWNEHDYYKASRAARAAWQTTNQQLAIGGLEEWDVAVAADGGSAAPSHSSSPPLAVSPPPPPLGGGLG